MATTAEDITLLTYLGGAAGVISYYCKSVKTLLTMRSMKIVSEAEFQATMKERCIDYLATCQILIFNTSEALSKCNYYAMYRFLKENFKITVKAKFKDADSETSSKLLNKRRDTKFLTAFTQELAAYPDATLNLLVVIDQACYVAEESASFLNTMLALVKGLPLDLLDRCIDTILSSKCFNDTVRTAADEIFTIRDPTPEEAFVTKLKPVKPLLLVILQRYPTKDIFALPFFKNSVLGVVIEMLEDLNNVYLITLYLQQYASDQSSGLKALSDILKYNNRRDTHYSYIANYLVSVGDIKTLKDKDLAILVKYVSDLDALLITILDCRTITLKSFDDILNVIIKARFRSDPSCSRDSLCRVIDRLSLVVQGETVLPFALYSQLLQVLKDYSLEDKYSSLAKHVLSKVEKTCKLQFYNKPDCLLVVFKLCNIESFEYLLTLEGAEQDKKTILACLLREKVVLKEAKLQIFLLKFGIPDDSIMLLEAMYKVVYSNPQLCQRIGKQFLLKHRSIKVITAAYSSAWMQLDAATSELLLQYVAVSGERQIFYHLVQTLGDRLSDSKIAEYTAIMSISSANKLSNAYRVCRYNEYL